MIKYRKLIRVLDKANQKIAKKAYLQAAIWTFILGAVFAKTSDAIFRCGSVTFSAIIDRAAQNTDCYDQLVTETKSILKDVIE